MSVAHDVGQIWKLTKNSDRLLFLIANHLKIDPGAVYNVRPPKAGRLTSSQTVHLRRALAAKPNLRVRQHIEAVLAESEK